MLIDNPPMQIKNNPLYIQMVREIHSQLRMQRRAYSYALLIRTGTEEPIHFLCNHH